MKRTAFWMLAVLVAGAPAWAGIVIGGNITIPDRVTASGDWYTGTGVGGEDQEVEPNCQTGQLWDLEAFYLDTSNVLTMVGGYDFENGVSGAPDGSWSYGDLFIDVDGDAVYGKPGSGGSEPSSLESTTNLFGYDYVLAYTGEDDEDGSPQFTAYALGRGDATLLVYYNQNDESNPWRYDSGGQELFSDGFTYTTALDDDLDGDGVDDVLGGSHNAVQVGLDWLWDYAGTNDPTHVWNWDGKFTVHFTQECGNDNLMGTGRLSVIPPDTPGTPVPEPASITLMGLGIAAVAVGRMRKAA